jgi:nitrous oxide reductase accessory protein NosL
MGANATRDILVLMQDLERRSSWTTEDRERWIERRDALYLRLSAEDPDGG